MKGFFLSNEQMLVIGIVLVAMAILLAVVANIFDASPDWAVIK